MSRKTYVQSTSNVYYSAPFFIMLTHLVVVVVVVFEMFDSKEICLNEKREMTNECDIALVLYMTHSHRNYGDEFR